MKPPKLDKKLTLNKLTVSSLNEVKGGADAITRICPPTYFTCYQYTCDGWTRCPDMAC